MIPAVIVSTAVALIAYSGAIDPHCTKALVCTKGYTKTVRPPQSYTTDLKARQLMAHGVFDVGLADFEEDHLIPLELCGHPTDPENLWPQPWPEARLKDKDETRLHRAVCKGQMTLEAAQDEIRRKWHEW